MPSPERRYTTPPAETSRWTRPPDRLAVDLRLRFEVVLPDACPSVAGWDLFAPPFLRRRRRRFLGGCRPSEVGSSVTRES
jgi:hypothetical protein